eukprot:6188168-Pleurochrysis_carterae.AAC.1
MSLLPAVRPCRFEGPSTQYWLRISCVTRPCESGLSPAFETARSRLRSPLVCVRYNVRLSSHAVMGRSIDPSATRHSKGMHAWRCLMREACIPCLCLFTPA